MASQHVVEAVEIRGALHFDEVRIEFADGLNCIIGGKGAGKTTVLHLVRFALGAPVPTHAEARARFEEQVAATLGGGTVTVYVRTAHGVRYTSRRAVGTEPTVASAQGERVGAALAGELFQCEFYGPHEIETIARDADAQLAVLDGFAEVDLRRVRDEIAQLERRLVQNAVALTRVECDLEEDVVRTAELPEIEEALKGLERTGGPDADEVEAAANEKTRRGRERTVLASVRDDLSRARARLAASADECISTVSRSIERSLMDGARGGLFVRAYDAVDRVVGAVEGASRQLDHALADALAEVDDLMHTLVALHVADDAAFAALLARHEDGYARAAASDRLRRRYDELAHAKQREGEHRREYQRLSAEREMLLSARRRAYDARSGVREEVAARLSRDLGGDVRVSLRRGQDQRAYVALLGELLHGTKVRAEVVQSIAGAVAPGDLARAVRTNDPEPLMMADPSKTNQEDRARRILRALHDSGRVREIETVALGDVPLLELRVGDQYRPSDMVSTGQSCTCVLPIVLLRSEGPLFLDQPEDNLDNAFIYDVLVQRLAQVKSRRQIVVVTHNANIPVLGDAERVCLLASDSARGALAGVGTVDDLRHEVERLLEGGSEAFLRRSERYGHGSRADRA